MDSRARVSRRALGYTVIPIPQAAHSALTKKNTLELKQTPPMQHK